ncbi:MAG: hypothetical protein ACXW5U_07900 [Thermoanaerobaculia bacterium]
MRARVARIVQTIAGTRRKRKMSTAAMGARFIAAARMAARMSEVENAPPRENMPELSGVNCHPEPAKRGEGPPATCAGAPNCGGSFAVYAAQDDTSFYRADS